MMARIPRAGDAPLAIGFVNNMPDAALRTTERQFGELLAAAGGMPLDIRYYALPEVPRGLAGRAHIRRQYRDIGALWQDPVDGLIVTGAEPWKPTLADEPYWPSLAALVDWAEENTSSAIWSCLAAHAAVLRIDGIERRPFGDKLSGIFESAKAADHPILDGMPARWPIPHSRSNDLAQQDLAAKGYLILLQSADGGADLFVKHRKSLFLFVQGHPEYDSGALLREYRRDVERFLGGKRPDYPELPVAYFDAASAAAFASFRRRAEDHRAAAPIEELPAGQPLYADPPGWRAPSVRLYGNWLAHLARRKAEHRTKRRSSGGR